MFFRRAYSWGWEGAVSGGANKRQFKVLKEHSRAKRAQRSTMGKKMRGYYGGKLLSHRRLVMQRQLKSQKRRKRKAEIVCVSVLSIKY